MATVKCMEWTVSMAGGHFCTRRSFLASCIAHKHVYCSYHMKKHLGDAYKKEISL